MLLTLFFIFSVSLVFAYDDFNSSDNMLNEKNSSVNNEIYEINHQPINHHHSLDLIPSEKSISKDLDIFGFFNKIFGQEEKHGYWVWYRIWTKRCS